MKALTTEQQQALTALIAFAGNTEVFLDALRETGNSETPFKELLERIRAVKLLPRQPGPLGPAPVIEATANR